MGFLEKIKKGLNRTVQVLQTDVRDLFKTEGRLVDADFVNDLFETLVKTDMGVEAAQSAADEIKEKFRGRVVDKNEILAGVKEKLKALMAQEGPAVRFAESGPTVALFVGVNGAGKTTSIAKLTKAMTESGKTVVLGAADTFRAAAVEQLQIWARRLGVECVAGPAQSDPASVAHKAVSRALEVGADLCLIDCAGRLHTQKNLMNELVKIKRVVGKLVPDAPHETFLVIDATTGQNGLNQAKKFTEAVDCTGVILTKLDGTAKGGVAVAIRQQVGLPVRYIGLGESESDFEAFNPNDFVEAMFS